jgi:hypothetical protein
MGKTISKTPSAMKSYLDEYDDLPADVLLGRIVVFKITDEPVSLADLKKWFEDAGLDEDYLPPANKALDAFKKATSDTKDSYAMSKGRTAQLLCRPVTETPDYVRRQITREIRDSKNKRLGYEAAITATFYRPTDPQNQSTARIKITVNPDVLEASEVEHVQHVARAIHERHLRYFDFLDGMKLRATVRGYLKKLNCIEIKGGVYFVHASRDAELNALADVVSRFGGECHMNMIPMVDLKRDREFMARMFEREASQSLNEVAREAQELLSSGRKITPAACARIKAKYDEVLANAEEHMLTLQVSQDVTTASAEVALSAFTRLTEGLLNQS